MNKSESTGAKSLEEILASIRKSLADEAAPQPKAAQPQPKPAVADAPPTKPASTPAKGGGMLSAKLAGAPNGAGRGPSLDPDLSELLAGEPKKPAPAAPAETSKPAAATAGDADGKDPLWFLSRLSAAAAGPAGTGSAARARDAAKAPIPKEPTPVEEIKLSRPETLRASLPPLFDAALEPAPFTPKSSAPDTAASPSARTEPRLPPLGPDPSPARMDAPAKKDADKPEPFSPMPFGKAPAAASDPLVAALAGNATSLPEAAEKPATKEPPADMRLAGLEPSSPPPAPEPEPPAAVNALPTLALEQMVAELLEPVIRQWLQSNLPRLIEKAVREEVAKAVAAERPSTKL